MTTATIPRSARPKSTKPVTHAYFPAMPGRGTLEIGRGGDVESYIVAEIGSDPDGAPGRTFRLRKCQEPEAVYDCHVAIDAPYSTCDCPDWIWTKDALRPYQCKHVIALREIVASGQIDHEDPELHAPPAVAAPVTILPLPAPPVEVVAIPTTIRLSCPICGESAEARPVRHGRYSHTFHCPACVERMEGQGEEFE